MLPRIDGEYPGPGCWRILWNRKLGYSPKKFLEYFVKGIDNENRAGETLNGTVGEYQKGFLGDSWEGTCELLRMNLEEFCLESLLQEFPLGIPPVGSSGDSTMDSL